MGHQPNYKAKPIALPTGSSTNAVVIRKRSDLKLNPANARLHSRPQLKQIARSIQAFGFNVPVLIDRENMVICGHGRLEACALIGLDDIPTMMLDNLTPEQVAGFAIAENRSGDTSKFDERQLALNLKLLAGIDLQFDLEAVGFSVTEIDLKIEGLGDLEPAGSEPAEDVVPPGPAVSRQGDLWLLGPHRILCGDALDASSYDRLLRGEQVACAFCDPPYGSSIAFYLNAPGHREFVSCSGELKGEALVAFFDEACRLAALHSADGAIQFWCCDWRHLGELLPVALGRFDELLNLAVWTKNNGGMGSLYRSAHELVLVLKKGKARHRNNVQLGKTGRNRTNVWAYAGANSFLRSAEDADLLSEHPTPKPVKLVADALLDVTARRDLVLDSFLGSGSSLMACERTGRRCRGIELDPLYVDLCIRRWQRMTGERAILEETGAAFDDASLTAEGRG